jgi:multicomponent Na+:H+ antiporter subunit G
VTAPASAGLGWLVWGLLGLGVLVAVGSAVGVLLVRDDYLRLHLVTPITSVAGPVIGVAVAVAEGWSLVTAVVLLTVGLQAVAGAALQTSVGRLFGGQRGDVPARRAP